MRPLPRAFALMPRHQPGTDNQQLGILLLLVAIFTFTLMDATAKYLSQYYHPFQVVWARYAGNMVIIAVLFAPSFRSALKTNHPWLQLGRGLSQMASVGLFFFSLQFIGLAEATAIMDINPVLITLGAALFLGERIGLRRALGIAAALVGAMIIIRPGGGVFQSAAILPLIGAFTYAAGAVLTRMVRGDSTRTSVLWSVMFGTIVTSFIVPFVWQPVAPEHLWAFILIGVLGTIAQTLLIRAFSMAEAAAVAPFGYTGLLWAALWGWLFWDTIPDGWTIFGAAIIVIAGLYVWSREAKAMGK